MVAQELDHKKIKFPNSRTVTGRLLFWDHMQDQVSYILVPPGDDNIDFLVYRASIPARLPPAINIDELTGTDPLPPLPSRPSTFDRSLHDRVAEEEMTRNPLDLDPLPVDRPLHHHDSTDDRSKDSSTHPTLPDDNRRDKDDINNDNLNDEDDDDVIVEYSLADAHSSLPADCPFTFLYLSSEDSTRDDPSHDTEHDLSLPDAPSTRQGTTHVSVTADEVLRSTGDTRRKWIGAGKTELDNLTNTSTITSLAPEQRDELRRTARATGQKYIELPAKAVFTIKPSKFKIRIVACGNKTDETFGRTSTTDLDTGMLRYLVSWAASLPNFCLASLDVTAAFLNAPLPTGRIVVLRPPTILYKLNLLPPGHVWLVHKAIYGLREAPSLWSEERTEALTNLTFTSEGEPYCVLLSQIHRSLCLIVRQRSLQDHVPFTDHLGLTC